MAKIQTGSQEAAYALYLRTLADELTKTRLLNLQSGDSQIQMLREVADYLEDLLE